MPNLSRLAAAGSQAALAPSFPAVTCPVQANMTTGALPDVAAVHQCVLAYASDLMLLDAALIPHGRTVFDRKLMAASLDHALWFHRPFKADEWLLYAQDSPSAAGARGFARGLIFTRNGTLVASVAQEGLLRERREIPRP